MADLAVDRCPFAARAISATPVLSIGNVRRNAEWALRLCSCGERLRKCDVSTRRRIFCATLRTFGNMLRNSNAGDALRSPARVADDVPEVIVATQYCIVVAEKSGKLYTLGLPMQR